MDYLKSRHKLTFDPASAAIVLCDVGSWIDKDVAFSLGKAVEVIDPVDSKNAFIRDGQTSIWTASIKVYFTEDLDVTALVNAMQSHVAVSALGKKPLRVEIDGWTGHYWQYSSSFIQKHDPIRETASGRARWSRQYDIVATGLSYT